jgi:hypothetical protein
MMNNEELGIFQKENLGAFFAAHDAAKNRAFRCNSSQTAKRFAAGFPLQSLARQRADRQFAWAALLRGHAAAQKQAAGNCRRQFPGVKPGRLDFVAAAQKQAAGIAQAISVRKIVTSPLREDLYDNYGPVLDKVPPSSKVWIVRR